MSETYIPLSQINTYVFCPRRFYYESVEGHQVINKHVEEGKIKHTRVDTEMKGRNERGAKVSPSAIPRLRHIGGLRLS